MIDSWTPE
jgi:ectoine hydroxylase-related dioxygenase (phytanoyl-CoA dioxygenase family)